MFRDAGHILVVDVEATCWDTPTPPAGERQEIIQIGYCWLNTATLERSEKRALYVKPVLSTVSEYCTSLTGITPKRAKGGMMLDAACKNLVRKAGSRRFAWTSWGRGDMDAFIRDCAAKEAEYPFTDEYINLSALASLVFGIPVRTSQTAALAALGIEREGREHDGADDAWNAAAIMAEVIRRCRRMENK